MADRSKYLERKYGITQSQWDQLYELQEGKCPICDRPLYKPDNTLGKRAAPVDHDHKSGRVRGLVCFDCNRFKIGRNTAESAKRLVIYLSSKLDGRLL